VITLVLGGARSGKSEVGEALAARHVPPFTYVATMDAAGDPELEERIDAHRARRDPAWTTVDAPDDLGGLLRTLEGTVLVDSLGPWVARDRSVAHVLDRRISDLGAALLERAGDTVVVSDEVGLSVHPSKAVGRRFRDELGLANRWISSLADKAYLVVAGRAIELPPEGPPRPA
jgi:adenosyl cobinamide kinase/adenosyl cobinamide phosphate guanylyltransferase